MNGKLDYINRQWYEYTGFDLEESKTKQTELVHPDDLETSSMAWRQAMKNKQKYEQEFRFKRNADGAYRWHYAKAIPFKDEQAILPHGSEHALISMIKRSNWKEKMNLLEWPVMN